MCSVILVPLTPPNNIDNTPRDNIKDAVFHISFSLQEVNAINTAIGLGVNSIMLREEKGEFKENLLIIKNYSNEIIHAITRFKILNSL